MPALRTIEAGSDLRELVRELVDAERDGDVLSMYVDLDPREFATAPARKSGITAAIDAAERAAPDNGWARTLEELRATFASANYDIDGARGLLLYARRGSTPTLVKLHRPVSQHIAYDHTVHVLPLVEAIPGDRWCVLLCNRRSTRMLLGDRDRLHDVEAFQDEVDGQHDQGGYSQARYQRAIEEQVHDHLRHTARVVRELHESGSFDRLMIGAPAELRGELESELHDSTRRVLAGWLDVDVEHATAEQVAAAASKVVAAVEKQRLGDLLARLQQQAGRNQRAALGLEEVLRALSEARVETLLVSRGMSQPGVACTEGDWLAPRAEECPVHGPTVEPVADVVEAAVEAAIRQSARVVTISRVEPEAELAEDGTTRDSHEFLTMQGYGSIAALLRFDLDEGAESTGPTDDLRSE